jgi:tellurite resistance protein
MSFEESYKIAGLWYYKNTFGWSLSDLPPDDVYEAMGKAMLICTRGDGVIAPAERNWVIGFLAARGMSPSLVEKMKTYEGTENIAEVLHRTIATSKGKRTVIYFTILACSADGEYHQGEQAAIRKMAQAIGLSEDEVNQLESMAIEEQQFITKRSNFLFPDGPPFGAKA